MEKLSSMRKKGKEFLEEIYTPYKYLTVDEIWNDEEVNSDYERYLKSCVVILGMIFINLMMLKIELGKKGISLLCDKYNNFTNKTSREPCVVKKVNGEWNAKIINTNDISEEDEASRKLALDKNDTNENLYNEEYDGDILEKPDTDDERE